MLFFIENNQELTVAYCRRFRAAGEIRVCNRLLCSEVAHLINCHHILTKGGKVVSVRSETLVVGDPSKQMYLTIYFGKAKKLPTTEESFFSLLLG